MLNLTLDEVKELINNKLANGQDDATIMDWLSGLELDTVVAGDAEIYLQSHNLQKSEASQPQNNPYIFADKHGVPVLAFVKLVNDLLSEYRFITLTDNEDCYIYQDGYYQNNAVQFLKAECQQRVGVGKLLTEHVLNEIIGHIKRSTYIKRETINSDKNTINLINGLLDVRTRELKPHTPDFLGTIRIPVEYHPDADSSIVSAFFKEVHHAADISLVEEIFGYCATPDYSIQHAFLEVGGGENGKSTELNLMKAFIGKDNISNVPWQALEMNRFAKSALEGKLVNIFADLPSQSLNMTTSFKMLTGGDAIGTEKKFGSYFSFTNFARLIFSANKPPIVKDEDSYAFWRRWIIINFPNTFSGDKKDVNILTKLTTKEALSGLLLLALDGLNRLNQNHKFSYNKTVDETTEYYLKASDPVYSFVCDKCEVDIGAKISKDVLFDNFLEYCKQIKMPLLKPNAFARALQNQTSFHIRSVKVTVNGVRTPSWQGLKLLENQESVQDVQDFHDFRHINTYGTPAREKYNDIGKNVEYPDNPDRSENKQAQPLIPSFFIGTKQPKTIASLDEKCPDCGSEELGLLPDGSYYCTTCYPSEE